MRKPMGQGGFSLVELMIVVAIIGTLATVAVPNLNAGAKKMLARSHLKLIAAAIKPLRINDDRNLSVFAITQNSCSACNFGGGTNLSNVSLPASYRDTWKRLGFDSVPLDPWRRPYMIDENDEEFVGDCRMDAIYSAGPDGVFAGQGDGDDLGGDDIVIRLPWVRKTNCRENMITGGY